MLLLAALTTYAQNRTTLVEQFTGASCPPCASINPGFNALIDANAPDVIAIKYQIDIPAFDPMYFNNPDDVDARQAYYSVNSVPNAIVDGTTQDNPGAMNQTTFSNALAAAPELSLTLDHNFNAAYDSVTVTGSYTNTTGADITTGSSFKLHIVLTEQEIMFPEPPGSTAEAEFFDVMVKMLTGGSGQNEGSIIASGATVNFSITAPTPSHLYRLDEMAVVAFVQDDADRSVLQAIKSAPKPVSGVADIAINSVDANGPEGVCDYEIAPSFNVTNTGDVDITSFDAIYSIGDVDYTQSYNGTITPGSATTIDFAAQTVSPGVVTANFSIVNVNGLDRDLNLLNNLVASQSFSTVASDAIGIELDEGFETNAPQAQPATGFVNNQGSFDIAVISSAQTGGNTPIGGYAQSDQALFVYFYNIQSGSRQLVFNKVDMADADNVQLSFDHAYRQYQNESDRLIIELSADCGANWTEVFNQAGADLATLAPSTGNFLDPGANGWATTQVDVSNIAANQSEVIIRMTFVSDYGNNLFLDNVNLVEFTPSAIAPVVDERVAMAVRPNPVTGLATIDLSLTDQVVLSAQVVDATGRVVAGLTQSETFAAGNHSLQWDATGVPAGFYYIQAQTDLGQVVERVVVAK